MSILHNVLWFRHRYSRPWSRDAWPESTVMDAGDVRVNAISLLEVAASVGTPCVRNAAAVIPGTGGVPSPSRFAAVVVTRVQAVETLADGTRAAWVDADLDRCAPDVGEGRVIGRPSIDSVVEVRLRPSSTVDDTVVAMLPMDLRVGDLVAVPCRGATSLRDIRPSSRHIERLDDDRIEHDRDEFPRPPCGR